MPVSTQRLSHPTGISPQILCRAKQAFGAITGNKKMTRQGQIQEDKGELKGKFDSTVDKTQEALDELRKTVNRT